jgi:phytoene dehydrogenase-like protein
MAGLSCGTQLQKAGVPFTILEASDGVGGRVRSDQLDGFILDRGFQIFLTSYPTAKELLDYNALDLKPFYAGMPLAQQALSPSLSPGRGYNVGYRQSLASREI